MCLSTRLVDFPRCSETNSATLLLPVYCTVGHRAVISTEVCMIRTGTQLQTAVLLVFRLRVCLDSSFGQASKRFDHETCPVYTSVVEISLVGCVAIVPTVLATLPKVTHTVSEVSPTPRKCLPQIPPKVWLTIALKATSCR